MAIKRRGKIEDAILGELIVNHPKVLEVLDRHGVTFCAGCFITLFSRPEKAAAYHAVGNRKKFLADLRRAAGVASPKVRARA
jgi:iron-sulfur cluster repair protein YtfE (RIC family)